MTTKAPIAMYLNRNILATLPRAGRQRQSPLTNTSGCMMLRFQGGSAKVTTDERIEALATHLQSVDQRLDRLTERTDAIAQSVELLSQSQLKTDKEIRRLGRYIRIIVIDHESRLLKPEALDAEDDGEER
jgi:hypothetical protein